jgi:hypothetical protein
MEQSYLQTDNYNINQKGQMLVEIMLAIALTAIMLPALLTGLFSSRQGKAQQQQRVQAVALLKEGEEVTRNIKENNWTLFATDGIYHPTIVNNNWTFGSGDETIDGLTRSITVSDVYRNASGAIVTTGGAYDPSTKKVFVKILWGTPFPSSVDSTFFLTRYNGNSAQTQTSDTDFNDGTNNATIVTNFSGGEVTLGAGGGGGDWCNPSLSVTSVDLSRQGVPTAISAYQGSVVTGTGGNASGPTFVKTSVTGNSPPATTFIGQFNNSKANSVFTENNYGYIATTNNSQEVQILDLSQYSNPPTNTAFLQSGYFNAPGNSSANSVFALGNVGYVTVGNKFYTFDLSSHTGSRPQLNTADVTLAGTGNKVIVVGNYAYVAVGSTITQLQIIDISNPQTPTIVASASVNNQPGIDVSINQTGTRAYLITNYFSSTQPDFYIIDTINKTGALAALGSGFNTNGMSPKGVSVATGNKVVIAGNGGSKQYQVINISNENTPLLCGSLVVPNGAYAVSSVIQSDGYAYSYVATGDSAAELKIILGGAGGQFSLSGTFTSSPIDVSAPATFNYFTPIFTQPNQTSLKFQLAVTGAVNGSCTNANYLFVGPDGTTSTYFTGPGQFPTITNGNYSNPERCMEYRAYFSTNDTSSSPTLENVSINYSP